MYRIIETAMGPFKKSRTIQSIDDPNQPLPSISLKNVLEAKKVSVIHIHGDVQYFCPKF